MCGCTHTEVELVKTLCAAHNPFTELFCCTLEWVAGGVYPLGSGRLLAVMQIVLSRTVLRLVLNNRYTARLARVATFADNRRTVSLAHAGPWVLREFAAALVAAHPTFVVSLTGTEMSSPYTVFVSGTCQFVCVLAAWDYTQDLPSATLTFLFNENAELYLGDPSCTDARCWLPHCRLSRPCRSDYLLKFTAHVHTQSGGRSGIRHW